jgi:hypothetical protein
MHLKMISLEDFDKQFYKRAAQLARTFTVPIVKKKYNRLAHPGTGVLLSVKNDKYIVSARHVLDESLNNIFIPGLNNFLPANGTIYYPRIEDEIEGDIAILHLSEDAIPQIHEFFSFLPVQMVDFDRVYGKWEILILGYPKSKVKLKFDVKGYEPVPFVIRTAETMSAVTNAFLIEVQYQRSKKIHGRKLTGPLPFGMSGCGLWEINPLFSGEHDLIRLASIAVFYDERKNTIKSVKMSVFRGIKSGFFS